MLQRVSQFFSTPTNLTLICYVGKDAIQPLPHKPSIHICGVPWGFSVIWTLVLKRKITQVTSYVWRSAEIARATVL